MVSIKTSQEISLIREGGKILSEIIKLLKKESKVGIKTKDLEKKAGELIKKRGVKPSFLNFEGYPAVLCSSINEEIVHAIPSERILRNGDILSLDLGIYFKGYHSDMAVTVPIGEVLPEKRRLIWVTKKTLKLAIKKSRIGNTFGDIGNTIQRYVEGQGFNVVRDLCGHGIGKRLHEPPQVLNFGKRHRGEKIKEGMVFCIEPMITMGDWKIKKSKDGYGYETKDGSLSCHFEHTIAITKEGPIVLTE
ncbi:MAG: type I methionyl aminopeptidase [Candidatus Pacebacteria bacterium]|nr:type I methionyl aminopeptidase [Candidatus Paceibacterota bacterium]